MPLPQSVYGKETSILITGASSGIGAALAVHLAQYGGKIALVARRREQLDEVAEQVRGAGARPLVVTGDVTDGDEVTRNHQQILEEQGPAQVAFLNAGVGYPTPLTRFDMARVRKLFEINVIGVTNWLAALLPDMVSADRGVIAVVSSLAAARGLPGSGCYSASKAAVSTLMESLRIEARGTGVQLSTIEPGFIKSELTAKNRFPMPFLMDTEPAARLMADEVAAGAEVIRFPWQMAMMLRSMRAMPDALYGVVGAQMAKKNS